MGKASGFSRKSTHNPDEHRLSGQVSLFQIGTVTPAHRSSVAQGKPLLDKRGETVMTRFMRNEGFYRPVLRGFSPGGQGFAICGNGSAAAPPVTTG